MAGQIALDINRWIVAESERNYEFRTICHEKLSIVIAQHLMTSLGWTKFQTYGLYHMAIEELLVIGNYLFNGTKRDKTEIERQIRQMIRK